MAVRQLTLPTARRMALAAQGFADRRPAPMTATRRHLRKVIDRVAVVQIDSVNAVTRSQYLPFYSRLGPYDPRLLDRLRDGSLSGGRSRAPRELVEYWAHEASLIEPGTWPLLGFRMRRALSDSWGGMQSVAREQPELLTSVLAELSDRAPMTSRELERHLEHDVPRSKEHWGWNWSLVKKALEHLFWAGQVTSAGRTAQFERLYTVPERVIDAGILAQGPYGETPVSDADAIVGLMRRAARANGVGTLADLRDYFRLSTELAVPALEALVAAGEVEPVAVQGWRAPAYAYAGARTPRAVGARALLSPFDSLIWHRPRAEALFDFHYRIEIYVPEHKRVHGYYVLPFLLGDRLVGRVDLRSERSASVLRVHKLSLEPGAPGEAMAELEEELHSLAGWLGLSGVALS